MLKADLRPPKRSISSPVTARLRLLPQHRCDQIFVKRHRLRSYGTLNDVNATTEQLLAAGGLVLAAASFLTTFFILPRFSDILRVRHIPHGFGGEINWGEACLEEIKGAMVKGPLVFHMLSLPFILNYSFEFHFFGLSAHRQAVLQKNTCSYSEIFHSQVQNVF